MTIKTTGIDQLRYFYDKIKEKTVAKDEVATQETLGLVKPGDGLSIEGDGSLNVITTSFVESTGLSSEVILGDGTKKSIEEFIQENIETIRDAIGLANEEHPGLAPKVE